MSAGSSQRVRFGPYEADLHTHELWKFGSKIRLVGQPFELLAIFLSKPGQLVTREELRNRLWQGDTFVDFDHGLNAAVNRLREALCDSAESPRYIETLPRRGYRFIARIGEPETAAEVPAPAAEPAAIATENLDPLPLLPVIPALNPAAEPTVPLFQTKQARPSRLPLYFSLAFVFAAFLAIAIVGAILLIKNLRGRLEAANSSSSIQRIKPLVELGDDTSEPAFSPDGSRIAFHRLTTRREESGIFVKTLASDEVVQLTRNPGDFNPAWSPDGRFIAFSRHDDEKFDLYIVPADGGAKEKSVAEKTLKASPARVFSATLERKLNTGELVIRHSELAWSPDGKSIVFSGGRSLILISLADSTTRRLTQPQPLEEDWGPTFSQDGQKLLFVRSSQTRFPEQIMSIPASGGESTQILLEHARILSPPQWSVDGQSVIFASDRNSHPSLWRVSLISKEPAVQINDSGGYPAVSPRGYRMAYERIARSLSVWELDLSVPNSEQHILIPATSETDQGPAPQFSPDGTKIAFMSDRSGTMEIWVADRDGKNPVQLSVTGFAGTPRWSPDSQSIVFDGRGINDTAIYAVRLKGGTPQALTAEGEVPSWSRDGKWIYFASTRSGDFQVWKVPAEGGAAEQVTKNGGHAPLASPDGRYIYYAKSQYANPEIWQVPVEGGAEKLLSALLRPATWASWAVVDQGIIFAGPSGTGRPVVELFNASTRHVTQLGVLNTVPFWLGATRDGKAVAFDQPGGEQGQLVLVENFR